MKARQILKETNDFVLVCCFARFASYDVKGRQVASGNGASCSWQHTILTLKPGDQTLSRLTQLIIVVIGFEKLLGWTTFKANLVCLRGRHLFVVKLRLQNSHIFCERERRTIFELEDHAYGASRLPKTTVLQSKGLITWAGLVWVRRDLSMFVKCNKNQLRDYITTGPAHTEAARLM